MEPDGLAILGEDVGAGAFAAQYAEQFTSVVLKEGTSSEIESAIRCPVCYTIRSMRIVCAHGHHVCTTCTRRLMSSNSDSDSEEESPHPACPLCRTPCIVTGCPNHAGSQHIGIPARAADLLREMHTETVCIDCNKPWETPHVECPVVVKRFQAYKKKLKKLKLEESKRIRESMIQEFKRMHVAGLFDVLEVAMSQRDLLRRELVGKMLRRIDKHPWDGAEALRSWHGRLREVVKAENWPEHARSYLKKKLLLPFCKSL